MSRWCLPRARRLDGPPEPGHDYVVPTVTGLVGPQRSHWPVIGHRHTDRDPGEVQMRRPHWHIDWRFVPDHMLTSDWYVATVMAWHAPGPPVLRRKRCWRATNGSATLLAAIAEPTQLRMAGRRCRHDGRGWVCPHRHAPLATIPAVDGVVTCPLHGLRVDAATGVVMAA
jgi:hypothetical protein